jgi:iron complex transport system substrate-binding protein
MRYLALLAVVLSVSSRAETLGPPAPKLIARVITVAPSLTETVVMLGRTSLLVGVSRFDEAPEVSSLPRVGGFVDPSVETIVSLKPDVVLVQKSPGNRKPIETLARLGICVVAFELNTLAQVEASILEVGTLLHAMAPAQSWVENFRALKDNLKAKSEGNRKTALFVVGFSPLVVAGKNSFPDELMATCGVANAVDAAETAWPLYSMEKAAGLKPTLVVDASDVPNGRDAVKRLKSFKAARWVTLSDKAVLHPGPALMKALPELCKKM